MINFCEYGDKYLFAVLPDPPLAPDAADLPLTTLPAMPRPYVDPWNLLPCRDGYEYLPQCLLLAGAAFAAGISRHASTYFELFLESLPLVRECLL